MLLLIVDLAMMEKAKILMWPSMLPYYMISNFCRHGTSDWQEKILPQLNIQNSSQFILLMKILSQNQMIKVIDGKEKENLQNW